VFSGCVLDVGCGLGDNARWLATLPGVERVVAMDFAPLALAEARARGVGAGPAPLEFREGDVFAPDTFGAAAGAFDAGGQVFCIALPQRGLAMYNARNLALPVEEFSPMPFEVLRAPLFRFTSYPQVRPAPRPLRDQDRVGFEDTWLGVGRHSFLLGDFFFAIFLLDTSCPSFLFPLVHFFALVLVLMLMLWLIRMFLHLVTASSCNRAPTWRKDVGLHID
jgi:SAM-dependent methyltransferase